MMRCQGKKVLITGASSGIGRACAEGFAKEGADLILCGRDEQRLQAVAKSITEHRYTKVLPLLFDITNPQSVENSLGNLPPNGGILIF